MGVKTKLWKHQQEMVSFAESLLPTEGFAYWLADCGVGKTLASYALISRMNAKHTLVITVKNAISQVWVEDAEEHTEGLEVIPLIKGTSPKKNTLMLESIHNHKGVPQVFIVNYETARLLDLNLIEWDLVVFDEVHRISSHNSKISLDLARLLKHCKAKVAMTGTAWADSPKQVFGQFRVGFPITYANANKHMGCKLFGSWMEFLTTYTNYYMLDNIPIIPSTDGYKNQEQLGKLVSPYIMRVKRSEVLDLPPITHIKRYVDLTPKHRKTYKEMEKEFTTRIQKEDGIDDVVLAQYQMTQAHRLHQLSRNWYVSWEGELGTLPTKNVVLESTMELLDSIGGRPTVIFTSYKQDVAVLKKELKKKKIKVLELTAKKKQHTEFQAGKADVIIVNIQAGSTGIKLFRAEYIIYYGHSPSLSRTNYLQSIERVHRPRQVNPVTVYHMLARDTVDAHIYEALTNKEQLDNYLQEFLK